MASNRVKWTRAASYVAIVDPPSSLVVHITLDAEDQVV